jgi:hypothetical protein
MFDLSLFKKRRVYAILDNMNGKLAVYNTRYKTLCFLLCAGIEQVVGLMLFTTFGESRIWILLNAGTGMKKESANVGVRQQPQRGWQGNDAACFVIRN